LPRLSLEGCIVKSPPHIEGLLPSERRVFVFLAQSPAYVRRPVVPTPTVAFEAAREADAFAGPLPRNRRVTPS
jgi:hypothetical protein